MKALQYIYTSWKNGDSTSKGYMIYSKSEGITDSECTAIKDAMQYLAPKELTLNPSPEEIADVFPYSFAYFGLPSGRMCVAQSTYLGQDYSGRFGNYIIYALVIDKSEFICLPAEMFGESYIKTAMTDEELNASSPVPPLPILDIAEYGSVVNDDQLFEFLTDRENEFAQVLSAMLAARNAGIPFYINDTRENLVQWVAAVQRVLPRKLSLDFQFSTYVGDHENMRSQRIKEEGIDFYLIGVRPDANYFNYSAECKSSRHIVIDFLNGYMTEDVDISVFAGAMASNILFDSDEIENFGLFIDSTALNDIDYKLDDGYLFYKILKDDTFEFGSGKILSVIKFGETFCNDFDNATAAGKLLMKAEQEDWRFTWDEFTEFWGFAAKYADYMIYSLYDLFIKIIYQYASSADGTYNDILNVISTIRQKTPERYNGFLAYQNTRNCTDQMLSNLSGNTDLHINEFYIHWFVDSYSFPNGLKDEQPISQVMKTLLDNVAAVSNNERTEVRILFRALSDPLLFETILSLFTKKTEDETSHANRLCDCILALKAEDTEEIEKMEQQLFNISFGLPLAINLSARRIARSKQPEDDFWKFYKNQRDNICAIDGFSIAPMVSACLDNLSESQRENAAFNMIENLDECTLNDEKTVTMITDIIEESSIKSLIKQERSKLRKAYYARMKCGMKNAEKICAVFAGKTIEERYSEGDIKVSLSKDVKDADVSLASFD